MRVWKFPANVDTDALAPGAYMQFGVEVLAQHCLKRLRPEFCTEVRHGDVIVAGPGFGIGSSREQAAAVLVHLGVAAVIAPSFGGLFFRNAFNLGLLALVCAEAESILETSAETPALRVTPGNARNASTASSEASPKGAALKLHMQDSYIEQGGRRIRVEPTPDFLLEMVRCGGLMEVLRKKLQ
jgi:3-isopropylmalate/(R)-2-methylmalate dehydratase small subunit